MALRALCTERERENHLTQLPNKLDPDPDPDLALDSLSVTLAPNRSALNFSNDERVNKPLFQYPRPFPSLHFTMNTGDLSQFEPRLFFVSYY